MKEYEIFTIVVIHDKAQLLGLPELDRYFFFLIFCVICYNILHEEKPSISNGTFFLNSDKL